jgi:hypothetical protein
MSTSKRELPLTEEDSLARGTLERLGINPGADYVVLGSYTLMEAEAEKRIRLELRLQDRADGETIAEDAITGTKTTSPTWPPRRVGGSGKDWACVPNPREIPAPPASPALQSTCRPPLYRRPRKAVGL